MTKVQFEKYAKSNRPVQKAAAAIAMRLDELTAKMTGHAHDIKSDVNLSDRGRRAKLEPLYVKAFQDLHRIQHEIAGLSRTVAKPKLPALAKDDVVGFLQDQEARAYVRSLAKSGKVLDPSDLPASIAAAVVRADPALSGVTPILHRAMHDRLLKDAFPEASQESDADAAALELVTSATAHTHAKLQQQAGFLNQAGFGDWHAQAVEPIEREFAVADSHQRTEREKTNSENSVESLIECLRSASPQERADAQNRIRRIDMEEHIAEMQALKSL
ncbi:MAG: hypothetical protein J0H71_18020 [Rhizobiales bacterium]|nr:hypothetical protein [Hyphomicrobiales bacterium]